MNVYRDADGCEVTASREDGTVQLHVSTPWDTYARVDLSPSNARAFALELLAIVGTD